MYRKIYVLFMAVGLAGCAPAVWAQATALKTQQAATPEPKTPPTQDAAAAENGQKTFQANCAFCHGATGKGGESGPDLLRSELVIDDEHGDKIGPVVHNGRLDKGMPKFPLSDAKIVEISAFLHDRIHAAGQRGTYQILNIVTGDPQKGEAYFNGAGGCTGCHSLTGDLAHVGTKYQPVDLQQHVVMPRQGRGGRGVSRNPKQQPVVTVTDKSGEAVKGNLVHVDDFTVSLIDSTGQYRSYTRISKTIPHVEITDPLQAHTDMLGKYTDADIHNLTAYLLTKK